MYKSLFSLLICSSITASHGIEQGTPFSQNLKQTSSTIYSSPDKEQYVETQALKKPKVYEPIMISAEPGTTLRSELIEYFSTRPHDYLLSLISQHAKGNVIAPRDIILAIFENMNQKKAIAFWRFILDTPQVENLEHIKNLLYNAWQAITFYSMSLVAQHYSLGQVFAGPFANLSLCINDESCGYADFEFKERFKNVPLKSLELSFNSPKDYFEHRLNKILSFIENNSLISSFAIPEIKQDQHFSSLIESLKNNYTLSDLSIYFGRWHSSERTKLLASLVKANKNIKSLNLDSRWTSGPHLIELFEEIKKSSNIESLQLRAHSESHEITL